MEESMNKLAPSFDSWKEQGHRSNQKMDMSDIKSKMVNGTIEVSARPQDTSGTFLKDAGHGAASSNTPGSDEPAQGQALELM